MKACDKILATMRLLRDNSFVGTLAMMVNRWQAAQKARGEWGIMAERNCGHRISLA
jgi:hypothetical protein